MLESSCDSLQRQSDHSGSPVSLFTYKTAGASSRRPPFDSAGRGTALPLPLCFLLSLLISSVLRYIAQIARAMPSYPPPNTFSEAKLSQEDAAAYLQRIALPTSLLSEQQPSFEQLSRLQLSHLEHVPKDTTPLHVSEDQVSRNTSRPKRRADLSHSGQARMYPSSSVPTSWACQSVPQATTAS